MILNVENITEEMLNAKKREVGHIPLASLHMGLDNLIFICLFWMI